MFKISLHNVPLANREIKTALIEYKASDLMSGAFFQPSITQYKVLPKRKKATGGRVFAAALIYNSAVGRKNSETA